MNFEILNNITNNNSKKLNFSPSPNYNQLFAIYKLFQIKFTAVSINSDNNNMKKVKNLVETNPQIKEVLCALKYSNSTRVAYSNEVVQTFASLFINLKH